MPTPEPKKEPQLDVSTLPEVPTTDLPDMDKEQPTEYNSTWENEMIIRVRAFKKLR